MAEVLHAKKACTVNPLKMSQPLGGALATMGVRGAMPLFHGSQGCTSFGLVLFVRHFREAIPLQTTAMSEVATVLGGYENVEKAVLTIAERTKPEIIGICSTGVTETKGDDVEGFIRLIREKHPELDHIKLVYVSTPDFEGAFQDGFGKTVKRMVEVLVDAPEAEAPRDAAKIAVLPGCHLTPGDLDELRDIIEAFGLNPVFLPDISGSLDGHIPEDFTPTTLGGVGVDEIAALGDATLAIAVGEQMRPAAEALEAKTSVPFRLFDRLTGLLAVDELISCLMEITGKPVPRKIKRQRGQLVDAMLDGHFSLGGRKIAIGAEPDLLWTLGATLADMGCEISVAVTTTHSPVLARMPCAEVVIGDLEVFETRAKTAEVELLITHAHGRQAAERLGLPLYRAGIPIFDRLGAAHITTLGYRGTRDLIFDVGNIFMADTHEPTPETWISERGAENLTGLGEETRDGAGSAVAAH